MQESGADKGLMQWCAIRRPGLRHSGPRAGEQGGAHVGAHGHIRAARLELYHKCVYATVPLEDASLGTPSLTRPCCASVFTF